MPLPIAVSESRLVAVGCELPGAESAHVLSGHIPYPNTPPDDKAYRKNTGPDLTAVTRWARSLPDDGREIQINVWEGFDVGQEVPVWSNPPPVESAHRCRAWTAAVIAAIRAVWSERPLVIYAYGAGVGYNADPGPKRLYESHRAILADPVYANAILPHLAWFGVSLYHGKDETPERSRERAEAASRVAEIHGLPLKAWVSPHVGGVPSKGLVNKESLRATVETVLARGGHVVWWKHPQGQSSKDHDRIVATETAKANAVSVPSLLAMHEAELIDINGDGKSTISDLLIGLRGKTNGSA